MTDISIVGFCLAHRLSSIEGWRDHIRSKGAVHEFAEPVELRAYELPRFMAAAQDAFGF
ncbi:hypothetical protein IDH50_15925 [Aeromicrobium tamlense]|uniref:Uncharacterized protein n=1 Tax=Aeromicrobium tamlense TaxID=375541 RepID=A0A8I0KN08_9ACTN|nr:hypothetical protein [Aeromicrobium tamlense]MBD1271733.1 hypothetical protein [Aeromicrobium tamlense]NYI37519.1 hypothetical protein [Aeromicrobium tamlense]